MGMASSENGDVLLYATDDDSLLTYKAPIRGTTETNTDISETVKLEFYNGGKDQMDLSSTTKDGKILMVRQYRNALDRFTLEIPAGKLDAPDEPKIECAARELEEETGFRSENLEFLMTVNTTVAFCDERIGCNSLLWLCLD